MSEYGWKDNMGESFISAGDEKDVTKSNMPVSLRQALFNLRMSPKMEYVAQDVFGIPEDRIDVDMLVAQCEKVNTMSGLNDPEVWISEDGCYRVKVFNTQEGRYIMLLVDHDFDLREELVHPQYTDIRSRWYQWVEKALFGGSRSTLTLYSPQGERIAVHQVLPDQTEKRCRVFV